MDWAPSRGCRCCTRVLECVNVLFCSFHLKQPQYNYLIMLMHVDLNLQILLACADEAAAAVANEQHQSHEQHAEPMHDDSPAAATQAGPIQRFPKVGNNAASYARQVLGTSSAYVAWRVECAAQQPRWC